MILPHGKGPERKVKKLDRNLIRKRDWDYSVAVFGVTPGKRKQLRQDHANSLLMMRLVVEAPSNW